MSVVSLIDMVSDHHATPSSCYKSYPVYVLANHCEIAPSLPRHLYSPSVSRKVLSTLFSVGNRYACALIRASEALQRALGSGMDNLACVRVAWLSGDSQRAGAMLTDSTGLNVSEGGATALG